MRISINLKSLQTKKPDKLDKITINKIVITKHFLKRLLERVYGKNNLKITEEEIIEIAGLINDIFKKDVTFMAEKTKYKNNESLLIPFYFKDKDELFYIRGILKIDEYTVTTVVDLKKLPKFDILLYIPSGTKIYFKNSLSNLGEKIKKILECYDIDPREFYY